MARRDQASWCLLCSSARALAPPRLFQPGSQPCRAPGLSWVSTQRQRQWDPVSPELGGAQRLQCGCSSHVAGPTPLRRLPPSHGFWAAGLTSSGGSEAGSAWEEPTQPSQMAERGLRDGQGLPVVPESHLVAWLPPSRSVAGWAPPPSHRLFWKRIDRHFGPESDSS